MISSICQGFFNLKKRNKTIAATKKIPIENKIFLNAKKVKTLIEIKLTRTFPTDWTGLDPPCQGVQLSLLGLLAKIKV